MYEEIKMYMTKEYKMYEKEIEIEFWIKSHNPILYYGEKPIEGYILCRIYKGGRYGSFLRGYGGNIMIINFEDGSIIKTNDLWIINESWVKILPPNVLTGEIEKDYKKCLQRIEETEETNINIKSYIF